MEDAEACFELSSDSRVGVPCGWNPHRDIEETRQVLSHILINDHTFCLVRKSDQRIIGNVGIDPVFKKDEEGNEVEIPSEREPYWNQGYMTEAARAAIDYSFNVLGLSKLHCAHFDFNKASARVQEKCGFQYDRTEMAYSMPEGKEIPSIKNYLLSPKNEI